MKVIRIALNHLHNEEWFEFVTKFQELVERFGRDTIGIKDLYKLFTPLCLKVDALLVVLRKSVYTKEMEEADKERDDLFRGFFGVTKGMQRQPTAAKQEAAERLYNLLEGYRKAILDANYEAESAAIHNLLQDLTESYKADVTLLALTDWVTAIDQAERHFLTFDAKRTEESVAKPKENLKLFRRKADVLYNAITNVLDARLLADGLGGDVVVDPSDLDDEIHFEDEEGSHEFHGNVVYNFVIAWNETVKRYRNILSQRAGRRAAKDNESGVAES
ncbi:MAG: DUF6261 family protein [Tannerellaceae bacterium]|jgi:hypothetical protein|nr:DUF6261 family protein [Tannerellaceae bacterium]